MSKLTLRPFRDSDIPVMEEWLDKDYIKKWYVNAEDWLFEIRERFGQFSFIRHLILLYDGDRIGFCQYYPCSEAGEDWYGDFALDGTYSIDYLIGEEAYLGKGLGKEAVRALTDEVFKIPGSSFIIVQPEKDNLPSCKSLLANGYIFQADRGFFIKQKQ